jgi:membrane-associated phospholipid phosphatase
LLSIVCLLIFTDIGNDWFTDNWKAVEFRLAEPILALRSPGVSLAARGVTFLGSFFVLCPLVVALVVWPRSMLTEIERAALLCLSLSASALNSWLKAWFDRPRPGIDYLPLVNEPYMSFPSGHSMMSLVIYGFLAYLCWQRRFRGARRLAVALGTLVFMIGVSRVYLAAHFPGDVLGGFCVGWPCLWVSITAMEWCRGELDFSSASASP